MTTDLREHLQATLGTAYTLERELGGGGMSRVFVAEDVRLGRRVVVKVLHPDLAAGVSAARFKREIRLIAGLQHPHVVPLLNAGDVDGLPYFTMPFVEGESLRARFARTGELPVGEAVRLLRELADALVYAHHRGVVHRDLKPENVLLEAGHALVTDFGIAKALATATHAGAVHDQSGGLTSAGIALGTPAYMAPEQAAGDPTTDHRADLYALGIIAYEALTGAHPFAGRPAHALLAAHAAEEPESPTRRRPGLPPPLAVLVLRLLAKRPSDRPQSAEEVVRELDSVPLIAASIATSDGARSPSPGATFRGRGRWATAVALLLIGLLGAGALLGPARLRWGVARTDPDGPTRIAVLPFDHLGPAADDDYFAEGLADAIRGQLAALPALGVVDARSAAQYRKSTKSVQEIGRELDVVYLLQGTVQWARGPEGTRRVQVRPALVRVADATTRWAEPYTAEPTDVFEVQADIARRVARALDVTLSARERQVLATAPTPNPDAYHQYLRGLAVEQRARRGLGRMGIGEGMEEATQAYTRAVTLDPDFGLAWARLAAVRVFDAHLSPDGRHALAREAVDNAGRLAPDLPETHLARGQLAQYEGADLREVVAEFRAAHLARPGGVEILPLLGGALMATAGGLEEGLAHVARAADLDPRTPPVRASEHFRTAGRPAEAVRYAERVIALVPDEYAGYGLKAWALLAAGASVATARAVLDSAVARVGATVVTRNLLTLPNDATGIFGEPYGRRLVALTLADFPAVTSRDSARYYITKAYYWRRNGERARALAYCDSVRAVHEPLADAPSAVRPAGGRLQVSLELTRAYACLGRRTEARRWTDALLALQRRPPDRWTIAATAHGVSAAAVFLGERDEAAAQLELAVTPPSFLSVAWVRLDPFYAPLRGHPRFEALLARASR